MKKQLLTLIAVFAMLTLSFAKDEPTNPDSTQMLLEAFEKNLNYKTGEVTVGDNLAKIKVPAGYKYLDKKDAETIIYDLWGNMRGDEKGVYGMLIPDKMKATDSNLWAFVVEYDEMGYVKDDDADKINYADLLKDMQEGEAAVNEERKKAGMQAAHLVGWAEQPHYDKVKKVLHWAKEIDFQGSEEHTLNYNIRVLGRKGVLILNAVGGISQLPEIKGQIDGVLGSVDFAEGNRYADFNPSMDKVAAYSIGGLVAGKVLAKVGFFAVIAKFGKVIFIAIAAAIGGIWKWIKSRMGGSEEQEYATTDEQQNTES